MRVSLVDDEDASGSITIIEELLDDLIDAEDSGFEVTTEGESMSISNGNGLGRLDENFMSSWSENKSTLVGQGTTMEVLQVPLIQIEQGGKIMSLPDDRIDEILIDDEGIWYVSGGAVSYQKQKEVQAMNGKFQVEDWLMMLLCWKIHYWLPTVKVW